MRESIRELKLALIGFGNVGQGFAAILRDRGAGIASQHNLRLVITAVTDIQKGSVADPDGLDPADLLLAVEQTGRIDSVAAEHYGWDALTTIHRADADVIVELGVTNLETAEPATTYLREALNLGRHVITTNKGPIALRYAELSHLARARGRYLGFEGTVLSGIPILRVGQEQIAGAGIKRIKGVLTGTTNFVLMRMEAGMGYASALAEAVNLGYSEGDSATDVEGRDSVAKVMILAHLFFGQALQASEVFCEGITRVTAEHIAGAIESGERWKLVGSLWREGDRLRASVRPERLPLTHPLAGIGGASSAISFDTELLGAITLAGQGAGRQAAGYAVLGDLLALSRQFECAPVSAEEHTRCLEK